MSSGLMCLLVFLPLDLKAQDAISSTENNINSKNIFCVSILQDNKYFAETEDQMRGYSDFYIAGLDHTMENLRLAQSIRERLGDESIDPNTLHIPEFAALIDEHITFIEEGIKSQKYGDEADRLKVLEEFKFEAQQRKSLETVTYRWWFNFNLRLSILATSYPNKLVTNDELEYFYKNWATGYDCYSSVYLRHVCVFLDGFPKRILIPTINNLGIMSINKTYGTGMHLIGLRNDLTKADKS